MAEWELEFGGEAPQSVSELMGEVVGRRMASRMSEGQRAAAAWYRANGDRERAHTTGVFLKPARVHGAPPVLGVYVDSHVMATDFGVNKDLYLARLANVGYSVSGIDFLVSREGYKTRRAKRERTASASPKELPELSPRERAEARALVERLPENLRDQALRAVELSKRRQRLKKTDFDETP